MQDFVRITRCYILLFYSKINAGYLKFRTKALYSDMTPTSTEALNQFFTDWETEFRKFAFVIHLSKTRQFLKMGNVFEMENTVSNENCYI